jgi:hypothetical protein
MAWVVLTRAFAARCDGILKRNESDFQRVFPGLVIAAP